LRTSNWFQIDSSIIKLSRIDFKRPYIGHGSTVGNKENLRKIVEKMKKKEKVQAAFRISLDSYSGNMMIAGCT